MCSNAVLAAFELLWFGGLCFHEAELSEFIIIITIIQNECHSNIIVDRLTTRLRGHSKKLRESESSSSSSIYLPQISQQ